MRISRALISPYGTVQYPKMLEMLMSSRAVSLSPQMSPGNRVCNNVSWTHSFSKTKTLYVLSDSITQLTGIQQHLPHRGFRG